MADIYSFGLASITIGDKNTFANPVVLGKTYKDTAQLTKADATTTNIESEEDDDPVIVFTTPAPRVLNWSIMNMTPAMMAVIMGGTVVAGAWVAPDSFNGVEKSVTIETKTHTLKFANVKLLGKENFQFRKQGVLLIDITGTVLASGDPAVKTYTFEPNE